MRFCHPASWRGSGLITTPYPGLTPWAMESVALSGSKFLGLSARQSPIYCAEGGFFQNVADISILYKIFGTRVGGFRKRMQTSSHSRTEKEKGPIWSPFL